MFEGLLENMKEQEAAMRQKTAETKIIDSLQGITIHGNANLDIESIDLDARYLSPDKKEELQEVLVACLANWKTKAEQEAGNLSAGMVDGMLPPGLDDLFKKMK